MHHSPLITQRDGVVVISGDAVPLLYRATIALAARHHRDGLASPALLHTLRAALYGATTSPPRRKVSMAMDTSACCTCQDGDDWISAGEAALLLGLSRRQVQRMAAKHYWGGAGAIRVGRTWALQRAPVLALAERRKAAK